MKTKRGSASLTLAPVDSKGPYQRALNSVSCLVLNKDANPGLLSSLTNVRMSDDLQHLSAQIGGKSVDCDLTTLQCRAFETSAAAPELRVSPDGRWAAFTRNDNLFVREIASGEERALTSDGAPFCSWAKQPDGAITIERRKANQKLAPFETHWSPDGRYLIAPRVDERTVAVSPIVEWIPTDGSRRPISHPVRLPFIGDRNTIAFQFALFDLKTGQSSPVTFPDDVKADIFDGVMVGWSCSRGQAFLLGKTIGSKSVAVFRLELSTGTLSTVLNESSAIRVEMNTLQYSQANIRLLGDGAELIWYSDRTGWGHLYLYDAQTGALKNAITGGDGCRWTSTPWMRAVARSTSPPWDARQGAIRTFATYTALASTKP